MNNKRQGIFITIIVILAISVVFLIYNSSQQADDSQQAGLPTLDQPSPLEASTILANATQPTYSGADLVGLREQCAAQAQAGMEAFAQGQIQIARQYNLNPGQYSLSQDHFNEKLGACLIVVDDSFLTPSTTFGTVTPNSPADTTYLVNVDENRSIMYCTAYGEPVTSRLCYDDQGNPGNLVSYDDWTNVLNQYLTE